MLRMNDLKVGVIIEQNGEPFEVLKAHHSKIARGQATTQVKLKSLKTGKVLTQTFQQSDRMLEAPVEKISTHFQYRTRKDFFFVGEKGNKIGFSEKELGDKAKYLKAGLEAKILMFKGSPVSVDLPVKVSFKVSQAPPHEKGDTAQGGTKDVIIETGAVVKTPFFVKAGDSIEVNTQTGEYVRRLTE